MMRIWYYRLLLCIFTILLVSSIYHSAALVSVARERSANVEAASLGAIIARDGDAIVRPSAALSFEYVELKTTTTVWADDRGEIVVWQKIRNTGTQPITEFSWEFRFGQTNYDPVLAWDELGALRHQVTPAENGIRVTAYLRRPLSPNGEYDFAITVSIADMTETNGDNGHARWTVSPGALVQSFVLGVTLPLSASIQTITPQPTNRVQSYMEWQRTGSSEPISIEITYRLRNDIPNVPLFLQGDPNWGSDTWYTYAEGTPGETIRKWGCNLTSAAMLINYYAAATDSPARTTPGEFNRWIRSKNITSVAAIYTAAMSYARELGVRLYMPENPFAAPGENATRRLQTYLRTGNPVILRVDATSASGIHFVVATGITTHNNQTTYTIHDPIHGATTLAERYAGGYTQANLFNSTSPDQRTLMSIIHSPAELVITDPLGRRVGIDPVTGEVFNEIPGAVYMHNNIAPADEGGQQEALDEKFVFIPSPLDGVYNARVIGTDDGSYLVENVATGWDGGISVATFSGVTTAGQIDEQTIEYDGMIGVVEERIYLPFVQR